MHEIVLQVRRLAGLEVITSRPARRVLAVALFALLTALGAYASVPLPLTQVPITLQTLFVLLSGALLGARLGAASQLTYLAAGMAGLPIFSGGGAGAAWLLGPTGGYLLAYPIAAWLVGALGGSAAGTTTAREESGGSWAAMVAVLRLGAGLVLGAAVILASGAAWLSVLLGSLAAAIQAGVLPFLLGDILKLLVVLLVARRLAPRTLGQL